MAKVSTNISLDSDLKRESQELFSDLGMDLTTAVTIFLKQAVREQGIPFTITRNVSGTETLAALREYDDMLHDPVRYPRYNTFAEAMHEVLSDA